MNSIFSLSAVACFRFFFLPFFSLFPRILHSFFVSRIFASKICAPKTNIHHKKTHCTHRQQHTHSLIDMPMYRLCEAIRILKFTTKKLFKQMRLIYQNTCFPVHETNLYTQCEQQFLHEWKHWICRRRTKMCNICVRSRDRENKRQRIALIRRLPTYAYKITSFAYFYVFSMLISLPIFWYDEIFFALNENLFFIEWISAQIVLNRLWQTVDQTRLVLIMNGNHFGIQFNISFLNIWCLVWNPTHFGMGRIS